jgi:tRNA (Thr-GGU) A37 N-methylase
MGAEITGFQVEPIGWVESPLTERARAPRQDGDGAPSAWLVFEPRVADGLRDILPGAEVIVLTWLHRVGVLAAEGLRIQVRPLEALDNTPVIDLKPVLDPAREG